MPEQITRAHLDKHVHTRLRWRVRLYLGLSVVIAAVILYRIVFEGGGVVYPLIALVVGLGIGFLLSRMFNISWDKDAEKVISRIDIFGTLLIVAYIIFEVSGEHLIEQWFHGAEVLTVILSLAGGAVLGRGLGMSRKMYQVLRENI
jgi:hypothetical protein